MPSWCHGVLVAPQRALATVQCAQQATLVVLVKKSGEAVAVQRTKGDLHHRELLTDEAGVSSSVFTVVNLETPVDTSSVLIQLDTTEETQASVPASSELLLGFSLTETDQQKSSDGGKMVVNSFNASVLPTQHCGEDHRNASLATQEAVACVLEHWSDVETCQSSVSDDRIVARGVQGHTIVYGFVTPFESLSSAVCSSSGTRTAVVRLVTGELLAHMQMEESTSASEKSEGSQSTEGTVKSTDTLSSQEPSSSAGFDLTPSSVTSEPKPVNTSSFTSSASYESSSEAADESSASPLLSSLPVNCALLSSSANASADAFAVAALIAPRFLVVNAEWWSSSSDTLIQAAATTNNNGSLWAIFFDSTRVRVRRVWFESNFYIQQHSNSTSVTCSQDKRACSLVVFELEREASSAMVTPFRVARSLPPLGVDLADTQLSVSDLALMRRGQSGQGFSSFARENQSVCSADDPQVPGIQCLDSTDPIESSESIPVAPVKTSFATSGKDMSLLLGLSSGAEMNLSLGKRVSQAFIELAAAHHRQFLDHATRNCVKWSTIVSTEDESYSSAKSTLVSFYDGHNADVPMDCGGVAIAPKYILTTASCVSGHKITNFSTGEDSSSSTRHSRVERVQIEDAHEVFSHPLYSRSQPLSRYNIALIELKSATLDVWMDLDNEVRGAGIRVSRMEIISGSWRPERVQDVSSCVAARRLGSNADFLGLVCAREYRQEVSDSVGITKVRASSASGSSILLHRTMKGLLLVGIELPTPGVKTSELSGYVSVLAAKQFITALASGYSWGPRPQAHEFKLPVAAKIDPQQSATALLDSQRYVVGLRVTKSGHNFCGGSLVAPTTVLTAAHCVTDGLANWVSVGSSAPSGTDAELIKVQSVRVHPLYGSPSTYSYDAAILELAAAAYAPTVALDNSADFADSVNGTMFGYGVTDTSSETLSSSVHILSLQLWSRDSCAKVLPDVDDSFLCAGGKANDDACTGDSGSPLVVTGRDGKDYLAGLVSAGYGCGIEGVPGLYTRTFAVAAFIRAYVVQPTWRYPGAALGLSGQADSTSQSSPLVTLTPASPVPRPSMAPSAGSQSQFPKLKPRTSAGSSLSDSEDREATGNSPLPVTPLNTTTSTATVAQASIAAAALAYQSAISRVTLRADLSPSVKEAVLRFVLGEYDHTVVSSSLVAQLLSVDNQISLFSSGKLDALVAVIEKHDALPLNRRKNRFGTMGRTVETEDDEAEKRCSGDT